MKRSNCLWLHSVVLAIVGCSQTSVIPGSGEPCSVNWLQALDDKVITGDGRGHGPDLGSQEWRSVVEFKLGVRGSPTVPPRDSQEWCNYIDDLVVEQEN